MLEMTFNPFGRVVEGKRRFDSPMSRSRKEMKVHEIQKKEQRSIPCRILSGFFTLTLAVITSIASLTPVLDVARSFDLSLSF
jgi:hypothetical protein